MRLKASTLDGPALFSVTPVVWVSIQFTQDTMIHPGTPDAAKSVEWRFHDFLGKERLRPAIPSGHSGGGAYSYAFAAEDAAKIQAWLLENGCIIESDEA